MSYGKAIELFLVNGTAESLITAELSNWNGKAIKIPRTEVSGCTRDDIRGAGVYFLICQNDDGTDAAYIGEAENVLERLIQHLRDYQSGKEKYYWNTAVVFVGRDLNKALIRYLENRFVEIAKDCGRFTVLTKNTYKNTVMKESQIASMEEFIDECAELLGSKIRSCHLKDVHLKQEYTIQLEECAPGQGEFPLRYYAETMDKIDSDMPMILEHLDTDEEYLKYLAYLKGQLNGLYKIL